MQTIIEELQTRQLVTGKSGATHPLHSAIDPEEGRFLASLISGDASVRKTLEIGCAYGISALHICHSTRPREGALHTILDPFQHTQWDGAGVRNLDRSGITFYELLEERSEFALPRLVQEREASYDLVFVDGWHTADHTLIDCFYATRLLRIGGYLVVDDLVLPAVRRVFRYFSQYPCYKTFSTLQGEESPTLRLRLLRGLGSLFPALRNGTLLHPDLQHRIFGSRTTRMSALQKISGDQRNWDWYAPHF